MYLRLLIVVTLVCGAAIAEEKCSIENIQSFYQRVKEQGPMRQEALSRKEQASASIEVAKQRPNPDVDFEYLKGDQFGIDTNTYSLSVRHVIEFGGKRDKRILKANSFSQYASTKIGLELYKANLEAIINFQRVAQLDLTIPSYQEAIHTFEKITKKLSSRKRLNPEETVSLSTLTLAANDYRAQLNDLENERNLLVGELEFLSGCTNLNLKYQILKYEELSNFLVSEKSDGLLKLEDLKVTMAQADVEIEKSKGYSNISVGPSFEHQIVGNDSFTSAGVSVTFALPLFQTNDGGKLEALRKERAQRVQSRNKIGMLNIRKKRLLDKYKRSLRTLKRMPNLKDIEKKHAKAEKLFARGVVSIPMTIESHRQQIDFLNSRFETENDLLTTFAEITLIDGETNSLENLF